MRRTGDGESLRASITSSAVCVSAGSPLIEISTSPGSTIFAAAYPASTCPTSIPPISNGSNTIPIGFSISATTSSAAGAAPIGDAPSKRPLYPE